MLKCSLSQWVYCSALCTQDLRLTVTWKAPEFKIIVVVPHRAPRVVLHSEIYRLRLQVDEIRKSVIKRPEKTKKLIPVILE